jgi:hypothetical protein
MGRLKDVEGAEFAELREEKRDGVGVASGGLSWHNRGIMLG